MATQFSLFYFFQILCALSSVHFSLNNFFWLLVGLWHLCFPSFILNHKFVFAVPLEGEQPPVQQQPEEVPDHLDQHPPLELPSGEVEQELLTLRTMLAQKDAEIEDLKKKSESNITDTRTPAPQQYFKLFPVLHWLQLWSVQQLVLCVCCAKYLYSSTNLCPINI